MEINVEHSKMRKDASKLRNHDFKIKFVELDELFWISPTRALKNVSLWRYGSLKIRFSNANAHVFDYSNFQQRKFQIQPSLLKFQQQFPSNLLN